MRRIPLVILVMLATVSCGAEANTTSEATESSTATTTMLSTATTTTTAPSTTTTNSTTTTTAPSTTTTTVTTTTTDIADPDAWVDGDTVLTAGGCYTETETGDETTQTEAPCEYPHIGEVVATGPTLCPMGISGDDFIALVSEYVGVAAADLGDWIDQHGIGASAHAQFDAGGLTMTMCSLVAKDGGDLTRSYRSG